MSLLTAKEAAKFLKINLNRLYILTREGKIPKVKMGTRSVRYDKQELERFIKSGGIQRDTKK